MGNRDSPFLEEGQSWIPWPPRETSGHKVRSWAPGLSGNRLLNPRAGCSEQGWCYQMVLGGLEQEPAWQEPSLLSLVCALGGGWAGVSALGIITSFCCALLTSAFLFPLDIKYSALLQAVY